MGTVVALFTLLVCLLPFNPSYADNFVINSGTWASVGLNTLQSSSFNFTASSSTGTLVGNGFDDSGIFHPFGIAPNGLPFSYNTFLLSGSGSFTVGGQTFPVGLPFPSLYNFQISGTALAPPPGTTSTFTTVQGFASLAGTLFLCNLGDPCPIANPTHTVTGTGFAQLELVRSGGGLGSSYEPRRLDIAFISPVPEPGSLLLLGSGLAGVAVWRVTSRKKGLRV